MNRKFQKDTRKVTWDFPTVSLYAKKFIISFPFLSIFLIGCATSKNSIEFNQSESRAKLKHVTSASDIEVDGLKIASSTHGPTMNLIDPEKKKIIKRSMTVREAIEILGPGYVPQSSGTGGVTWYFWDGSSIGYIIWTDVDNVPSWNGI